MIKSKLLKEFVLVSLLGIGLFYLGVVRSALIHYRPIRRIVEEQMASAEGVEAIANFFQSATADVLYSYLSMLIFSILLSCSSLLSVKMRIALGTICILSLLQQVLIMLV